MKSKEESELLTIRRASWSFVAVLALGLAGVTAYGGSGAAASTRTAAATALSKANITVISCTDANPFCSAYNAAITKDLEAVGAKVSLLTDPFDPVEQAQHMSQAIASKPTAIVLLASDANAIVPSLLQAKRANIPVFNVVGRLTNVGAGLVTASILTDNTALGRFAAQNLVAGMRAAGETKGNVIAITGTQSQLIVQDRLKAFENELAKTPQYKLAAVEDGNWDQATSMTIAEQLFAKLHASGGVAGAFGMGDGQALGIIQAAKNASVPVGVKNKGLIVVGSDCFPISIAPIQHGSLYATGTQIPATEAAAAANVADRALSGKRVPRVTTVKEQAITAKNIARFAKPCNWK